VKLEPIGRVENPEDLDVEPIVIPVVAYTTERKEIVEEIASRPYLPTGAAFAMLRTTDGTSDPTLVMKYLDKCVLPTSTAQWRAFLDRDDIFIEMSTLTDVYKALIEVYGARPTMRRASSTTGRTSTKRTSQGASRAKASASKRSRSRSA
jgi:hypothetical protein